MPINVLKHKRQIDNSIEGYFVVWGNAPTTFKAI